MYPDSGIRKKKNVVPTDVMMSFSLFVYTGSQKSVYFYLAPVSGTQPKTGTLHFSHLIPENRYNRFTAPYVLKLSG